MNSESWPPVLQTIVFRCLLLHVQLLCGCRDIFEVVVAKEVGVNLKPLIKVLKLHENYHSTFLKHS